jgi:hypothetical protein
VNRDHIDLKRGQDRQETTDTVNGAEEDDGASGVAEEEVVEVVVLQCRRREKMSAGRWGGERGDTHLLVMQALDLALLQRLDKAVLRREVDDLGVVVAEIKAFEEVVCETISKNNQFRFQHCAEREGKREMEAKNAPKLLISPAASLGGAHLLFVPPPFLLKFLCSSLLMVAEKTNVRMSSRAGMRLSEEREVKSLVKADSSCGLWEG